MTWYVCPECGSPDVSENVWRDVDTKESTGDGPADHFWCYGCDEAIKHISTEEEFKREARARPIYIVGFDVIEVVDGHTRAWKPDGSLGLHRGDDGLLYLLDSDGDSTRHGMTDEDAEACLYDWQHRASVRDSFGSLFDYWERVA